ncbi:MAG: TnpV protein [Paludibacteraceae bacterium]|nr:TnpV protein [Paludibacteraceae bacterium]
MQDRLKSPLSALLGEGRLNAYLADVDEQAHKMLTSLTVAFAKTQGIDEHLKATDQMRWVQMMNNVRNSAEETVMRELILA